MSLVLLSGCKIHKDVALGRYAAEKILSIDPEDASAQIMLSNIYAEAKMWNEATQVQKINGIGIKERYSI